MTEKTLALDWESRFQAGTTPWQRESLHPAFLSWRDQGILAPGRILVPGAGRSAEPLALAQAGFSVTVVDAAASAVAFQRDRLAGWPARVEQGDLLAWDAPELFDMVYEQTCLCALPPPVWPAYAARLHGWLRPGGVLAALFMQTGKWGGPPYDCSLEAMRTLFAPEAWLWPQTLPPPVTHPRLYAEQPAALTRR